MYSRTSDKGLSDLPTKDALLDPLFHSISTFLTSEKRITSQQRTKVADPKVSFEGSTGVYTKGHCIITESTMAVSDRTGHVQYNSFPLSIKTTLKGTSPSVCLLYVHSEGTLSI